MVASRRPSPAGRLCCADGGRAAARGDARSAARHGAGAPAARRRGQPDDPGRGRRHRLRAHGQARRAPGLPRPLQPHGRQRAGATASRSSANTGASCCSPKRRIRLGDRNYGVRQMTERPQAVARAARGHRRAAVPPAEHLRRRAAHRRAAGAARRAGHGDAAHRRRHRPHSPLRPVLGSAAARRAVVALPAGVHASSPPRAEPMTGGWVQARFDGRDAWPAGASTWR